MKIHDIAKIFTTCAVLVLATGTVAAAVIDLNQQTTYEGAALVGNTVEGNTDLKTPAFALVEGIHSMKLTGALTSNDRLFTLVHEGNILYAKLNVDENPGSTGDGSLPLDEAAEYGYINLTENIGSLGLGGEVENLEQFTDGLDENLPADTAVSTMEDSLIAMSNYCLAAGEAFYWDFGGYGLQFGEQAMLAALDGDQVPEPATWFLLVLGMAGLFVVRQRNSCRKQELLHA